MTPSLLVGVFHGILTGATNPAWSGACTRFIHDRYIPGRQVVTIARDYYELPLPRLAGFRNAKRIADINGTIAGRVTNLSFNTGVPPEISFVAHSNGSVLALCCARACIDRGEKVRSLVLMAPALRAGDATKEIAGWIANGMLGAAVLVLAEKDKLMSFLSYVPGRVTWPWGALGREGWSVDDIPETVRDRMHTVSLVGEGHSTFLNNPAKRAEVFQDIVAPALGLPA